MGKLKIENFMFSETKESGFEKWSENLGAGIGKLAANTIQKVVGSIFSLIFGVIVGTRKFLIGVKRGFDGDVDRKE